ncbi:hypothetical protein SteCoe_20687 [Stentor coeruleus]|uniref:tRNA-binding domain-containing protein n=1 Tax=Stentor coeruleus TaxID=5963 RepID=A0A1R2BR77_9CILI|nr:hypothetical protein SteCoe_20687 [Stentor coeruleus]
MMARTTAALDEMIQKLEDRLSLSHPPVSEHSGQHQVEKPLNPPSEPEQIPVAVKCALLTKPEESKAEDTPQANIPTDTPIKVESKDQQPSSEKPEVSHPVEESKAKTSHDKEEAPVDMSKAPYDLFPQIDIRVGKIVECWKHPSSENLYCEKIDVGEASVREIGSGLQQYVPIADMSGNVCVMANLRPRKLAGFNSNGMVMALHKVDHGLELVRPGDVPIGERVGLEDMVKPEKSQILAPLNPKKKVLEKAIAYFGTDAEGYACFGLKKLITSAGFIKTNHPNSRIS